MIDLLEVNGKRYPFLFSMDVVWFLSGSGKIDIKEEGEGKEKRAKIIANYDDLIELFLIANQSAIEYEGKGESLTAVELKNGIRKDPKLFIQLQEQLSKSEALKMFEDLNDDKKKT